MTMLPDGVINDLTDKIVERFKNGIETTLPLVDNLGQKETIAVKVTAWIFGFTVGVLQELRRCSYSDATMYLAESIVSACLLMQERGLIRPGGMPKP